MDVIAPFACTIELVKIESQLTVHLQLARPWVEYKSQKPGARPNCYVQERHSRRRLRAFRPANALISRHRLEEYINSCFVACNDW